MKERLSATLTKVLKGKEKSWQNSARENGSTFSGLTSVTVGKDADADIWCCMETIEFIGSKFVELVKGFVPAADSHDYCPECVSEIWNFM